MVAQVRGVAGVSLVLVLVALAGCLGSGEEGNEGNAPVDDVFNPDLSGEDLEKEVKQALEITETSEVGAPSWTVGEYWTVAVTFSDAIGGGEFTTTIVVAAEDASTYTLMADHRDPALFDALFDLPFMGAFDKETLDTTFGREPFKYYDWPMVGGKSWQAQFDPTFEGQFEEYTFHAAFMESIPTPDGALPGYDIHGIDGQDFTRYQYDYVPALHWFNHVYWFNENFPGDLENADVHLMVTDHGYNWEGELVSFGSELAIEKFWLFCPVCVLEGEDPVTAEPPVQDFTIAEGVTNVAGFHFALACDGAAVAQVVAPSGTKAESQTTGLPGFAPADPEMAGVYCAESFGFIDEPAEAGTWSVRIAAAGAGAGAFVRLFALTEQKVTLPAAAA